MKNFIFKSSDPDLQKMFSILENLQKNILYLTYSSDQIKKVVTATANTFALQKQVDEYFDETSPQTDIEDK